jgi:ATP/maltotriose-dependent transcriptional regulator MalT
MADLLKRLIEENIAVKFAGRILSVFREDAQRVAPGAFPRNQRSSSSSNSAFRIPTSNFHTPQTSQPLVEPLTNRELEVLGLLAQRLRNKEIAAKLFVSPVTIKKHLTSIYGKLNVIGRLQAIEKADSLGILRRR